NQRTSYAARERLPRSGENAVKTASVGDPQRRQHGSHRLNFSSGGTVPGAAATANLNRARGLAPFHSGHRMVIGRSIAPRASTVILAMPLQRSVLPDMHYPPKRYATLQERPLGRHLFLGAFEPDRRRAIRSPFHLAEHQLGLRTGAEA